MPLEPVMAHERFEEVSARYRTAVNRRSPREIEKWRAELGRLAHEVQARAAATAHATAVLTRAQKTRGRRGVA